MMKQKSMAAGLAVLAICAAFSVVGDSKLVNASGSAGTATDPVALRSYVDERYDKLAAMINSSAGGAGATVSVDAVVAEVMSQLEFYYAAKSVAAQAYEPVYLLAGQYLIGGEGAEIIPRSGTSTAYTAVADGVVDVTDGRDLKTGAALTINHMLIVPRSDGRGARAVTNCWFLVKGPFEVR